MRLVVVGGVAGGASAAAKARRCSELLKITVFEAGNYVSFANCGLPFFVGNTIQDRSKLILNDAKKFKDRFNIDVCPNHHVESIDRERCVVRVRTPDGTEREEPYDKLILAPGAGSIMPFKEAAKAKNVFGLKTLVDADRIKAFVESRGVKSAAVVGSGFIGIEATEALVDLGLKVTLIEGAPHILPAFDEDVAFEMKSQIAAAGVDILAGKMVEGFELSAEGDTAQHLRLQGGQKVTADLFLVCLGVRPNVRLAVEAGLDTNKGIIVDQHQQTSDPKIYAAGDVCETKHLITGERAVITMAGPANKQGRVAGANAAGTQPPLKFKGSLGTAIVGFQTSTVAMTGISERIAKQMNKDVQTIVMHHKDHASYYPGAESMLLKLVVDRQTDCILGAQISGHHGVDKRIDVIATAIHGNLKADELADLDLAYAPQFGSARDPVIMMGLGYSDVKAHDEQVVTAEEFFARKSAPCQVIDCRTAREYEAGHVNGAENIPEEEIRTRLDEVATDGRNIFVYCLSGFRAYLTCRILQNRGVKNVFNVSGGWNSIKMVNQKE